MDTQKSRKTDLLNPKLDLPVDDHLDISNLQEENHDELINKIYSKPNNASNFCGFPPFIGKLKLQMDDFSTEQMSKFFPGLKIGGRWAPRNCPARQRVAVIIPYRNRRAQLRILLNNLHSLLIKQQLDYGIFVVEQKGNETMNKAKLINIGFVESQKHHKWDCFIFHDVDLIPENDKNLYRCSSENPRHLSVAVDTFDYILPYPSLFGGVVALTREQMESINGYSNSYYGWGSEDDDVSQRLEFKGHKIERYPPFIGRYTMIKHKREKNNVENLCRFNLIAKSTERMLHDGLSNLNYSVVSYKATPLYTYILVDSLIKESKQQLRNEGKQFSDC